MIWIKLEGHDFKYEVEDIIKLFYNDEEVVLVENSPPVDYRGIFVFSGIKPADSGLLLATRLDSNGMEQYNGSVVVGLLPEETKKSVDYEGRKQLKRDVKRQVYMALSKFTGKEMPWGILTGIRPAKIVHELLENRFNEAEIKRKLTHYYKVSEQKVNLVCDVAVTEREILDMSKPDMISLYIGIPFCRTRCLYCSFTSNPVAQYAHMVKEYLKSLKNEITGVADIIKNHAYKIQSIYIGGGTPTSLNSEDLGDLLEYIEQSFDLSCLQEYTLEGGRPDSLDGEKLETVKKSRADRISINPQTMNDDTLRLIGRSHTAEETVDAFRLARQIGFDNINMDIIVGLPGEDINKFEETLKRIKELGPDSLTVHTLAIKRASRLNEEKKKYRIASEVEAAMMIDTAAAYAYSMGLHPYYLYRQKNIVGNLENVGYCRPGTESIYNIQIMEEKQTIIALGAGGITKAVFRDENRIERAFNVKSVEEYVRRVDEMIERKKILIE